MSPSRLGLFALTLSLLAGTAATQGALENGVHVDRVNGFTIRPPERWSFVPNKIDEKWIAAKYLCDRDYTNKGGGGMAMHRPDMKVVTFAKEKLERKTKVEQKGDTTYIGSRRGRVFRNYMDFLKADLESQRAGFYVREEVSDEVGGIPVTKYNVSVHDDLYTRVAWVYENRDDESSVAVEFTVLSDRFKNLEKDFEGSWRTFRHIEKTEVADDDSLESPMWTRDYDKWKTLPQAERWDVRRRVEQRRQAKYIETAPDGWYTMESKSGRYLALSHASKEYTKHVLASADAMRDWLDDNLGDISDEYVMVGIIRICQDRNEYRAYRDDSSRTGASSFSEADHEVVDFEDKNSGSSGGGLGILAVGLFNNYVYDKDRLAYLMTPHWLDTSLGEFFQVAELKGRRLRFKPDMSAKVRLKEAKREDALHTFQEIVTTPASDWPTDRDGYYRFRAQRIHAVRFMVEGPGKRHKLLKGLIPNYYRASIKAGRAWAAEQRDRETADTVEAEEARAREGGKSGERFLKFMLDHCNKECMNFSDKEWEQLNKLFAKYVDKA